jgi:hypothetical protein
VTECPYQIVCPFHRRLIPIHDTMYREHEKHYCHGDYSQCAIMMVMKAASFLTVPKDLYPNQTFRVDEILQDHRSKT